MSERGVIHGTGSWILTASKAGLMATQHSFQKSPGVKPSMALTSWENLWIPATGESVHSPGIQLGMWVQGCPHRHSTLCSHPSLARSHTRHPVPRIYSPVQGHTPMEVPTGCFPWQRQFLTIKPGDSDGFQEHHGQDGAAGTELLQQLHHVGSPLQQHGEGEAENPTGMKEVDVGARAGWCQWNSRR